MRSLNIAFFLAGYLWSVASMQVSPVTEYSSRADQGEKNMTTSTTAPGAADIQVDRTSGSVRTETGPENTTSTSSGTRTGTDTSTSVTTGINNGRDNTGAIAGGAAGGSVALTAALVGLGFLIRKIRQIPKETKETHPNNTKIKETQQNNMQLQVKEADQVAQYKREGNIKKALNLNKVSANNFRPCMIVCCQCNNKYAAQDLPPTRTETNNAFASPTIEEID